MTVIWTETWRFFTLSSSAAEGRQTASKPDNVGEQTFKKPSSDHCGVQLNAVIIAQLQLFKEMHLAFGSAELALAV